MMSHDKKFIFIHSPKTAGNSIHLALRPHIDGELYSTQSLQGKEINSSKHTEGNYELRDVYGESSKHTPISAYLANWYSPVPSSEYFKFTCVRNPWDRVISWLFYMRGEFDRTYLISHLKDCRWMSQEGYDTMSSMVTHNGKIELDFIIRFENIQNDFLKTCHAIGVEPIELPLVNKSSHDHYTTYYDDELIELVRMKYQADITNFNYVFRA